MLFFDIQILNYLFIFEYQILAEGITYEGLLSCYLVTN